jgi:methylthioribose-1-phosphate isomerase
MTEQKVPRAVEWIGGVDGFVRLIDQTRLPTDLIYRDCTSVEEVWESIRTLRVRGAPAIGVAAALGSLLGLGSGLTEDPRAVAERLRAATARLRTSRPTAVNLFWALDRMVRRLDAALMDGATANEVRAELLAEARAIAEEDAHTCRAIGDHGAPLVPDGGGVLTHCNAGALATAEYGTALAVLYRAAEQGKRFMVYADETRPLLQGARLTAWELQRHGLDVTLLCDSMAAQVMKEGRVQMVVVGADRIAANGDTANKIGTYGVAVLARAHRIPFYVAAPSSTFDPALPDGCGIPIEQRDPREVTCGFGRATAPEGVRVYNPAFDVTPANLIDGLITEAGVIRPVTETAVRQMLSLAQPKRSEAGNASERRR